MRPLAKTPEPEILRQNQAKWNLAYQAARGTPDEKKAQKWGHATIREALRIETRAKCAYCEGFVDDVSFPHVEHIVPKSFRPDLSHAWENLTSACGRCNTYKDDFYDEHNGLLDPYRDELDKHLVFVGSFIHWPFAGERGELTVHQLRLNRLELIRSRTNRIADVRIMLDRWYSASSPLKEAIERTIRIDMEEGEFSQTVRTFLSSMGFPLEQSDAEATLRSQNDVEPSV